MKSKPGDKQHDSFQKTKLSGKTGQASFSPVLIRVEDLNILQDLSGLNQQDNNLKRFRSVL